LQVTIRDGENFESLLKRFSSGVKKSGLLAEYRGKQHFVSKGEAKRVRIKKSKQKERRRAARATRTTD